MDDERNDNDQNGLLRLHDLEHYIRSNGITQEAAGPNLNEAEEARRYDELEAYQQSVHKRIFSSKEKEGGDQQLQQQKEKILEDCKLQTISFKVSNGKVIPNISLFLMASKCDTIYAYVAATSRRSKTVVSSAFLPPPKSEDHLYFDLEQFDYNSVESFIHILKLMEEQEEESFTKESSTTKAIIHEAMKEENIVDCLKISHYLQCLFMLEPIIDTIAASIDAENCMSICQLSDQLQIPRLLEESLSFIVNTFDNMQNHELWDDMPSSLQNRLLTLRNAISSSIIGRGQKSQVFFHSTEEFLAIFSDSIHEQKERLSEAKLRQEQIVQERIARGGRHRDPYGRDVRYAATKIKKQEERIKTLQSFYQEQKLIFASVLQGL